VPGDREKNHLLGVTLIAKRRAYRELQPPRAAPHLYWSDEKKKVAAGIARLGRAWDLTLSFCSACPMVPLLRLRRRIDRRETFWTLERLSRGFCLDSRDSSQRARDWLPLHFYVLLETGPSVSRLPQGLGKTFSHWDSPWVRSPWVVQGKSLIEKPLNEKAPPPGLDRPCRARAFRNGLLEKLEKNEKKA